MPLTVREKILAGALKYSRSTYLNSFKLKNQHYQQMFNIDFFCGFIDTQQVFVKVKKKNGRLYKLSRVNECIFP